MSQLGVFPYWNCDTSGTAGSSTSEALTARTASGHLLDDIKLKISPISIARWPWVPAVPEHAAEVPLELSHAGVETHAVAAVIRFADVVVEVEREPTKVTASLLPHLHIQQLVYIFLLNTNKSSKDVIEITPPLKKAR